MKRISMCSVDSLLESLNNEDDDGGESASLKHWIHDVSEFIPLIPAVQFVKLWWIFFQRTVCKA